ncbi:hypothetical protein GZH46_00042, partial [Fragariocoptes setiger]
MLTINYQDTTRRTPLETIFERTSTMITLRRTLSSLQVTAITFGLSLVIFILMLVCLTSSFWIVSDHFRQGLLFLCVEPGFQRPLPFGLELDQAGCFPNRDVFYIKFVSLLVLLTILADMAAAFMSGVGLCSSPTIRNKLFKLSLYSLMIALVSNIIGLVVYPAQFVAEIEDSNRDVWELHFAYGLRVSGRLAVFSGINHCGQMLVQTDMDIVAEQLFIRFFSVHLSVCVTVTQLVVVQMLVHNTLT